jgi:hypothetical protein
MPISRFLFYLVWHLLLIPAGRVTGQIGGLGGFQFLDLPTSARVSALGGTVLSLQDGDPSLAQMNPALLDSASNGQLSVNHSFHLAGIRFGSASFSYQLKEKPWTLGLGMRYINYGEFTRADEFANPQGIFTGQESAIQLSAAHHVQDRLTVGAQLSLVNARYDTYGALGLGLTLAAHYHRPKANAGQWSLVLRNIGGTISHFNDRREPMQTALLIAYTKRLEHLPFRYFITLHNIERWDIRTTRIDQSNTLVVGGPADEASAFAKGVDNLFRHFIFGGELSIGAKEQVQLRFSYDHQRAKELGLTNFRSMSGFNYGFGIRIAAVHIDYGYSRYHLAGGSHQIGIRFDTHRIFSKL